MKKISSILLVTMLVLSMLACSVTAVAEANFPSSTIKILVPFNAGGSTDMLARTIAPEISTRLGVPVIVENRPGGGGAIGMIEMIQSKPDGHTLILCSANAAVLTPNMSDVGYTNKEMTPISQLTKLSTGIIVNAETGITNLEEFIAYCEEDYGSKTYCTTGVGSVHHLAAELFMQAIGKPGLMNHVPFDSGTEAITAVLGKQIDFSMGDAADCLPFVEEGSLLVVATASDPGRDFFLSEVPSFKEQGVEVGQMGPWTALAAPAGTPDEVINRIDEVVKEVLELPNVIETLTNLSLPVAYMDHDEITAKWMDEYEVYKVVIEGLDL